MRTSRRLNWPRSSMTTRTNIWCAAITVLNNGSRHGRNRRAPGQQRAAPGNFATWKAGWKTAGSSTRIWQATINPGERRTLELTIAPPRAADAEAGDHAPGGCRAGGSDYPERYARVGVTLADSPLCRAGARPAPRHTSRTVSRKRQRRLPSCPSPWSTKATAPSRFKLAAGDRSACAAHFDFLAPGATQIRNERRILSLRPGQRVRVPLRATVQRLPLIGLHAHPLPLLIAAAPVGETTPPRRVRAQIQVRPLIGPLQLASLSGLVAAGVIAVMLMVIVTALFVRAGTLPAAAPTPAPVVAAPPVIIVSGAQPAGSLPKCCLPVRWPALLSRRRLEPTPLRPIRRCRWSCPTRFRRRAVASGRRAGLVPARRRWRSGCCACRRWPGPGRHSARARLSYARTLPVDRPGYMTWTGACWRRKPMSRVALTRWR